MVTRRLLVRIVTEIRKIMTERGISSRELADLCAKKGFNTVTRSKILRAFYVTEGRQFFLNNTDDTIEAALTVLGYTGDDLLKRIFEKDENIVYVQNETELPQEVINFIRTKEAEPYLKLAYAQYKNMLAQKELENIQREIEGHQQQRLCTVQKCAVLFFVS